jgi:hypothetical protein
MKSLVKKIMMVGFFSLVLIIPFLRKIYIHGGIKGYQNWKKKRRQTYLEYIEHVRKVLL